jgi:naphthalene 1,2-dioxygenase system ferredoxin subunit
MSDSGGADKAGWRVIARVEDIPPGEARRVEVDGCGIAIYHVAGEFHATDDTCTHMRARLSDGYLDSHVIECPLHFGRFDVRTGAPLSAPCTVAVRSYPVRAVDGRIAIRQA